MLMMTLDTTIKSVISIYPDLPKTLQNSIPTDVETSNILISLFNALYNKNYIEGKKLFFSIFLNSNKVDVLKAYFIECLNTSRINKILLNELDIKYVLIVIFNEFTLAKKSILIKNTDEMIKDLVIFNDIKKSLNNNAIYRAEFHIMNEYERGQELYEQHYQEAFNSFIGHACSFYPKDIEKIKAANKIIT